MILRNDLLWIVLLKIGSKQSHKIKRIDFIELSGSTFRYLIFLQILQVFLLNQTELQYKEANCLMGFELKTQSNSILQFVVFASMQCLSEVYYWYV